MIRTLKFKLKPELIPLILDGSLIPDDLADLLFQHLCTSEGVWNPLEDGETREVEIVFIELGTTGRTWAEEQFVIKFASDAIEKTQQRWKRYIRQTEDPLPEDATTNLG